MRKEREGKKRWWPWGPALLIVLLLLLLMNFRRNQAANQNTSQPAVVTIRPPSPSVSVQSHVQTKTLTPTEASKTAQRKIRRAYAQLVRATSYRRVMTFFNPEGRSPRFTLVHLHDMSGKDFFRCDTENLSENHPEEAISDRTEITNAAGNWQLRKTPGAEEVAMLVSSQEIPNNTVAAHAAFSAEADGTSSHSDNIFAESSFIDQGQSFVRIVESNGPWHAEYVLDAAGNLVSESMVSGGKLVETESYQINPPIDPNLFEIPEEKIPVQTSDANRAASFLWEESGELNKHSDASATSK